MLKNVGSVVVTQPNNISRSPARCERTSNCYFNFRVMSLVSRMGSANLVFAYDEFRAVIQASLLNRIIVEQQFVTDEPWFETRSEICSAAR
jgi:hypothetical protein